MINLDEIKMSIVDVFQVNLRTRVWEEDYPVSSYLEEGTDINDLFRVSSTIYRPTTKMNVIFRDAKGRFVSWKDIEEEEPSLSILHLPNT